MGRYHFHRINCPEEKDSLPLPVLPIGLVQKLECTYYGEVSDYTRKGGVVLAEIDFPQQAPAEIQRQGDTLE